MAEQLWPQVDQWLTENYPQMEESLCQLLRFPTVEGEPAADAPFGLELRRALDFCLDLSSRLGFAAEDLDGYVALVDWPGRQAAQIGVLTHIDVVPAIAEDWQYAPYEPVIRAGRIYGRGAIDDKGPMIATLYAMAALKQCCGQLDKTVRHIIGCNEESGFKCMDYFLAHRQQPECGFSPDARFPAVIGEKGIYHFELRRTWQPQAAGDLLLLAAEAGTATNVIPAKAWARFRGAPAALQAAWQALPAAERQAFTLTPVGEELLLEVQGVSAHASLPEEGRNAIGLLLRFLQPLAFAPAEAKQCLQQLAEQFADDQFGASSGLAAADALSRLTLAPTTLSLDGESLLLGCDMRFPVSQTVAETKARVTAWAAAQGFALRLLRASAPLYVPEDSPLVQELLAVYREQTGDQSPPLVIGGGTYARVFKNFIGYGPDGPDDEMIAHQADEYIAQKTMLDLAKLYARAIYRLAR